MAPRAAAAIPGTEAGWTAPDGTVTDVPRGRVRATPRRKAAAWGARVGVVGALVVVGMYGAYQVLPNATITIVPSTHTVGPLAVTVTADANVGVPDPGKGIIAATRAQIPLSQTDTFPTTGTQVTLDRAHGTVRFTSANTLFNVSIAPGTRVSTQGGVDFTTDSLANVPKANIDKGRSSVTVPVTAVRPGPDGNVNAGAITVVSQSLAAQLASGGGVTNPDPTTGGGRSTAQVASKDDYRQAQAALTRRLQQQLDAEAADPATAQVGLTAYPATATLGKVVFTPAIEDVVGSVVVQFDLTAEATGSMIEVDESQVKGSAAQQLVSSVPPGTRVYQDTVQAQLQPGTVKDGTIVYVASVTGSAYTPIDASTLLQDIKGKSIVEARSILAEYGIADVSMWPDFVPNLPDDVKRINVRIQSPQVPSQ
jgi:hypothetical protein